MMKQSTYLSIFIKACIGADILLLAWSVSSYDLEKLLGHDNISRFACIIAILFLALLAAATIYIPFQFKNDRWKALLPFTSQVITIVFLILLFVPLDLNDYSISPYENIRAKLELQINQSHYEKTIRKLESGEFTCHECSYSTATVSRNDPNSFIFENKGGVISVFFNLPYLHVSSMSGFIYRSNDTFPPPSLMDGFWTNCQHEKQNWYYCINSD